jgi:CO dehydrogenase maturation factor
MPMRIAVVGKGGSGKTTTSAVVARALARGGSPVVALDCDTNPNLGISLGLGDDETERLVTMREAIDEGEGEHAPTWEDIVSRFGADAPDGVRVAVVSRIDEPEPG